MCVATSRHLAFLFDGDLKEIKQKLTLKLRINIFINSKLPGVYNCIHIHSCVTLTFLNFYILMIMFT